MFEREINMVKGHFKQKRIPVNEIWLQECVSWAMRNRPPEQLSISKLQDFAYQQWLLGDLREISPGCLPPNVHQHTEITLTGAYTLQAEQVIDIANPKYTQLKVKRGGVTERQEENEENSEVLSELTEWGRGPQYKEGSLRRRKLMFVFSDGKQEIQGLEYHSLPSIKGMIFPGTKMQILGPIECRRGVLMLEPKHLQFLGGEVDTLLVPNAPENILARYLGLPENPEPYTNIKSTVPEPRNERPMSPILGKGRRSASGQKQTPFSVNAGHHIGTIPNRNVSSNAVQNARSTGQNIKQHSIPTQTKEQTWRQQQNATAIEFDEMDDLGLTEGELLALERESNQEITSSKSTQGVNHNKSTEFPVPKMNAIEFNKNEFYLEIDLDNLESQAIISKSSARNMKTESSRHNIVNLFIKSPQTSSTSSTLTKYTQLVDNRSNFNALNTNRQQLPSTSTSNSSINKHCSRTVQELDEVTHVDSITEFWKQVKGDSIIKTNRNEPTVPTKQLVVPTFVCDPMLSYATKNIRDNIDELESSLPQNTSRAHKEEILKDKEPPLKKIKSDYLNIESSASLQETSFENVIEKQNLNKPKLPTFLEKAASGTKEEKRIMSVRPLPKQISRWPFVYLNQLQNAENRPPEAVVTLLKKLKTTGDVWNLELRLCDGSDNLDVEFSNQMQILGPIECRRGVLMLEPKHLQFLGGEVDTLLVPNAPENILARYLGLPENPEPYTNIKSTVPEPRNERPMSPILGKGRRSASGQKQTPFSVNAGHHIGTIPNRNVSSNAVQNARSTGQNIKQHSIPTQTKEQTWRQQQNATAIEFDEMDDLGLTEGELLALERESNQEITSSKSTQGVNHNKSTEFPVPKMNAIEFNKNEFYLEIDLDNLESQAIISKSSARNMKTESSRHNIVNLFIKSPQTSSTSSTLTKYTQLVDNRSNFNALNTNRQQLPSTSTSNSSINKHCSRTVQELDEVTHVDSITEFWKQVKGDSIIKTNRNEPTVPTKQLVVPTFVCDPMLSYATKNIRDNIDELESSLPQNTSRAHKEEILKDKEPPLKKIKSDYLNIESSASLQETSFENVIEKQNLNKPKLSTFLEKAASTLTKYTQLVDKRSNFNALNTNRQQLPSTSTSNSSINKHCSRTVQELDEVTHVDSITEFWKQVKGDSIIKTNRNEPTVPTKQLVVPTFVCDPMLSYATKNIRDNIDELESSLPQNTSRAHKEEILKDKEPPLKKIKSDYLNIESSASLQETSFENVIEKQNLNKPKLSTFLEKAASTLTKYTQLVDKRSNFNALNTNRQQLPSTSTSNSSINKHCSRTVQELDEVTHVDSITEFWKQVKGDSIIKTNRNEPTVPTKQLVVPTFVCDPMLSYATKNIRDNIDELESSLPQNTSRAHKEEILKDKEPPLKKIKSDYLNIESSASLQETSFENVIEKQNLNKPKLSTFLEKAASGTKEEKRIMSVRPLPKQISRWPFVYLNQLKNAENRPPEAVVKACVVTLLKKLKTTGDVWNLELRLCDGSDNLDVEFSNQVLEKLIGYSVVEYKQMKVEAKDNLYKREKLAEAFAGLKNQLIDMICLMRIKFSRTNIPCVVQLMDLDESHLIELQARQM